MKIKTTFALSIVLLFGVGAPAKTLAETPTELAPELTTNQYMLSAQTTHHGSHSPWQGSPRRGFKDVVNSNSESIFPHRGSGR
ncbi:MAG: hypothetical protein ACP5D7_20520 [Limnospira sp.]